MNRDALQKLSKDDLITLVLLQAQQIEALMKRVAELEAKLGQPPRTPDNSSLPPSRGLKPNRPEQPKKPRQGRPGTCPALAEHPDRVIETFAKACPQCRQALTPADQPDAHAYDPVALPPIKPVVTRVHRHRAVCPCCRHGFSAPAPAGLEPGSPFGHNLCALIVHLHVTQAISFERLAQLRDEVSGVEISEGAIANILARAEPALSAAADRIAAEVRTSPVIAADGPSGNAEGGKPWPGCAAKPGGSGGCCPPPPSTMSSPTPARPA